MTAQVAADLRAAADVLRRDGWTRGKYVGEGGCRCAIGAIVAALGGSDGERSVPPSNKVRLFTALAVTEKHVGVYPASLDFWNDLVAGSAAEVIAALEAAADAAEAKQ